MHTVVSNHYPAGSPSRQELPLLELLLVEPYRAHTLRSELTCPTASKMGFIQAHSASTPQLHSIVVANACCSTSPTREYAPAPQA